MTGIEGENFLMDLPCREFKKNCASFLFIFGVKDLYFFLFSFLLEDDGDMIGSTIHADAFEEELNLDSNVIPEAPKNPSWVKRPARDEEEVLSWGTILDF